MNRNIFSAAILIFSFIISPNALVFSAEVESAPKIRSIVLYPDSALIKKESAVAVKKGENIISISGLTTNLTDGSVQVTIKEKGSVKISDVRVEKTYLQKTVNDKIENLQVKLDSINDLINTNSNEILAIKSSIEFLKKIVPFPQSQKVTQSEVETHAKFIEKSSSSNYERVAKLENNIKKLNEEKKTVENELKSLRSSRDESKTIRIKLLSQADNEINLGVSYIVTKAGWSPHYDVRADSASGKVDIVCYATITQGTGEDWKNADIEISTARPIYGPAPELSAWYVDIYKPRTPIYKSKRSMEDADMQMMSMEKASAMAPAPLFEEPKIKTEATSLSFILPGKINIPSDNQPHRILIASASKEAKLEYYAVPKLSRYAYLRADMKNPFPFPIVSGQMSMFLDERFVNTIVVDEQILPDGEMNLALGIDEGIKLERKLLKKFTQYSGVISKGAQVGYEYTIDIASAKDKEIGINIRDNFPVSKNEQIKVFLDSPKKEETKLSDDGIISWDLKLSPNDKKTLKIKFRVEYAKSLRITGLE
ncbi:MAG: mucoidy inhibitor MuiA family protein [Nitrospirae bacterium]|nr:mucoidy inhibitor MuiA family protein [Nitrospirota bacterium]